MYCDFHTHTSFSSDGKASPEEQIEKAISLGMKKICITDHHDIGYPNEHGLSFTIDPCEYTARLRQLREKYSGKIGVLIGVELGLQPNLTKELGEFVSAHDFDFVIGSTHLVGGEDPCFSDFFETNSESEAVEKYLRQVLLNVKSFGDFDVVGHIDYIVRYTPSRGENYNCRRYFDIIDEILKTVIDRGQGIECNTSRIGCGKLHCNPHEDIIKRYGELGGEIITIGSDSHMPKTLANGFGEAGEILKSAGFGYYSVFENRKPEFIKL